MKTPEQAWAELKPTIVLADIAKGLGLGRAAVSAWPRVPAEAVVQVETLTGIPRETLRPDLYRQPLPWNDKETQ